MTALYPENFASELEFDVVLEQVVQHCATEDARSIIRQLKPSSDPKTLTYEWQRTDEILQVFLRGETLPALAVGSGMKTILNRLTINQIVLEEKQIQQIRGLAETYAYIHRYFFNRKDVCPVMYADFAGYQPEPTIVKEIDKIIDERGEVRGNASKALADIRRSLASKRKQADRLFYKVVRSMEADNMLADFRESVKDNRRVLAVIPAYKSRVKGIFHGSSAKHTVLFVEPSSVVEINNDITRLIDDERREIRKILQELCRFLQGYIEPLVAFDKRLVDLDVVRAKAQWAERMGGVIPQVDIHERTIRCKDAFHPVLKQHNDAQGKPTVPLSLELTEEQRIIVISGPNAGGKSIALKTIGLLSLLLQSGIPIPVHPESQWCVFKQIMGDIGDHQSIENELSTYSSRITKMVRFLSASDEHTLLLIDEFGSGSDPDLGSSLAAVCLRDVHASQCLGIITTHFNNIKALASELPGAINAAMAFHRERFSPLYTLRLGSPGSSYTFEVAENVGLSKEIIGRAREGVNASVNAINSLLVELQDEKQRMQSKAEQLEEQVQDMRKRQEAQKKNIAELEEKVEKQRKMNEDQSDVLMWGKRFKQLNDAWVKNPTKDNKPNVGGRFWKMMKEASVKSQVEEEQKQKNEASKASKQLKRLLAQPLKIGDQVKIIDTNLSGVIEEIKNEKFTVKMGLMSTSVGREKLVPIIKRGRTKKKKKDDKS